MTSGDGLIGEDGVAAGLAADDGDAIGRRDDAFGGRATDGLKADGSDDRGVYHGAERMIRGIGGLGREWGGNAGARRCRGTSSLSRDTR